MRDAQLIDVPDEDAPQLLADVCILSTYRAVYLSLHEGIEELMEEHRDWGLETGCQPISTIPFG